MPNFNYVAIDERGKEVVGSVLADSRATATARVREMGFYPTEISAGAGEEEHARRKPVSIFSRVSQGELTVFTRQLANLFNAGLPVLRCLSVLLEHTENARLNAALEEIHADVQAGGSLRDAFGKHPRIFPPLYVNLVRAGEASGELGPVLDRLSDFMEYEQEQRSRLRSAMAYPILLIVAMTAAVFFIVTFLIPQFREMFEDLGQSLPAPTVVLLAIAGFMRQWWWLIISGFVALWMALKLIGRTPVGGYALDRIKLKLPLIGGLVERIAVSRFSRTLGTLVKGGVPLLEAFDVVRGTIGNRVLDRAIDEVHSGVREGESIAEPLKRTGVFPNLLTNMIAVGEETGALEEMLNRVADAYDVEVQNRTRQLISLVEPSVILVMGCIVAFVVLSILLPVFQASTSI
ncbi:MAG: type II secretion system inner membrane protein GspF [Armatimonadota bacterium]